MWVRSSVLVLMLCLGLVGGAWAQQQGADPEGSVAAYASSEGTIRGAFGPEAAVESRDIFTIVQKGKPIGEAMVVKVGKGYCTLLPKGTLKGTPRVGDVLRFVRHAEMPVDGSESWKTFTAEEFSVSVPAPLQGPESKKGTNDAGNSYLSQTWVCKDLSDGTVYMVDVYHATDFRKLTDGSHWSELSFDESIANMAKALNGKTNWMRKLEGFKFAACDYELTLPEGRLHRGRYFVNHTTVYSAYAITHEKSIPTRAWKFFNSFKITPKE